MTDKQERFCRLYVRYGDNGFKAYRKCGYSKGTAAGTNASILLEKPLIQTYIKGYRREYAREQDSNVEGVLEKLRWVWRECKEEKLWSHLLKCIELEGKYHKMFSDKVIIGTEAPSEIDTEAIPELLKRSKQLSRALSREVAKTPSN